MFEDTHSFTYPYAPIQEFQIFMHVEGQPLLVASYFSGGNPPDIGQILDINLSKEEPGYPDAVRVLSLEEHDAIPSGTIALIVYSVLAEPA